MYLAKVIVFFLGKLSRLKDWVQFIFISLPKFVDMRQVVKDFMGTPSETMVDAHFNANSAVFTVFCPL